MGAGHRSVLSLPDPGMARLADSPAFDWICSELERRTALDRLQARGTVRLALKEAGLQSHSMTPAQTKVLLERVLPGELTSRGIEEADGLCTALMSGLRGLGAGADRPGPEAPEEVFRRLGGGA